MRKSSNRVAQMVCALSASTIAAQVLANSGIQLPLSQYQAGQEQTTPVTNSGFEADGMGNVSSPIGWTPTNPGMVVNPVISAPPLNPAADGSFAAQSSGAGMTSYDQALTGLTTGQNYVLSAYVWNSGTPDPSGSGNGDLATVKVVDPNNGFNNVSMTLEGTGTNGQSGSTGRLMYMLFNQADVAAWSGVNIELISESGTLGGTPAGVWAQYDNIAVTPARNFVAQKWLSNVSGNWTDDSKWLGGVNPNAQVTANPPITSTSKGAIASFTDGITSNQTVTVTAARTVAIINFDNPTASYTINGSSTISLDITTDGFGVPQGSPEINVLSGNHTISAPVTLLRNTLLNVVPAGGSLTLTGNFLAAGRVVTKRGAGLVTVPRMRSIGMTVEGGTLKIAPNSTASSVSKVNTMSVLPGAKFDLTDNKIVTSDAVGTWTGSNYDGITGLIKSGRNGGAWTGSGIVTSVASGNLTTIGIATGAQVKGVATTATATWAGQTVTGSDALVMYTYGGDANLDGKINVDDYTRIDFNVPLGSTGWYNGDFNYDGKINVDDYTIIDFNVGIQGAPFFTGAGATGLSAAAVPEPTTLGAAAVALIVLGGRRRRTSRRGKCHSNKEWATP
jgi:hypothetical protein